MKNIYKLFIGLFSICVMLTSCSDGIDPITPVEAGADMGAPEVTISAPLDGNTIKVLDEISSVDIKFKVVDDIEIDNIEVMVDGNVIATMNDFLDYRIVNEELTYDNIANGDHSVTIKATDMDGNSTSKTVNFSKEPPYTPKFQNEFLYMPFDGDYVDLITLKSSEVTGNLSFAGESFLGSNSFTGASDSYLNYPFDGSIGTEFTATFWYKVSGDPDRAGILVAGADENRTQGFRLFREGSADAQTIKLNVGTGAGEVWNDGGTIDPNSDEWVHVAFTVTSEETVIYLDGMPVNTGNMAGMAIDWTGVEQLTIGAGGETFSYWNHLHDTSSIDELRFFDAALSQEEIQSLISASSETLKISFDGSYQDAASNREVTVVGNPGFAGESVEGTNAYAGAEGSYLTMSSEGLLSPNFSAAFWYKVNASPNRAGIIVVGPEDADSPDAQNDRTSGFRFFRENGADGFQRFKLNVGDGTADTWVDGGTAADVANDAGWVHLAFTISQTTAIVYINGVAVKESEFGGIDWTGTDLVSIMSGAPRFTEWGHLSDVSYMDDLTFYNKVLTPEEIQDMASE